MRAPNGVYAMRYATRDASVKGEHFYGHPGDCSEPWPIHYYVWVVMYGTRVLLVDTGFTQAEAARRGNRDYGDSPVELLGKLGVAPDEVTDIVITHLHYDHTGFVDSFPRATVYLQRGELVFWESPMARRGGFSHLINSTDVEAIHRLDSDGRLVLLDGSLALDDRVSVHLVGGHTPGMQVVRVAMASETVVLASDASHFYANVEDDVPYGVVHTLPLMYQAFDTLQSLAGDDGVIVPGHDPLVAVRHQSRYRHDDAIIPITVCDAVESVD